ncbi:MAG: hypothetical protein COC12_04125 [Rhodobacteraceae bacterium]|nr:MAG: hypothetical protein COC12_04125 [Paracoccaceae bacterium]
MIVPLLQTLTGMIMNNSIARAQEVCGLCSSNLMNMSSESRCDECVQRGDLVGAVVWDLVAEAVRDAGRQDRVTFMLAGLPAVFLEGIARSAPGDGKHIEGRALLVAINPNAAHGLRVQPPAIASVESAVHWRHSIDADVIVFAPSDAEREGIGAGLGPLARIDGQTIVNRTSKWLEILGDTGAANSYLQSMIKGLQSSQVFIDLEMWVDFILAIKRQDFTYPPHHRVQNAAPALRIPIDGFTRLPLFKLSGNPRARPQDFQAAFRTARAEVGVYAGLMTPKQEPIDIQKVRHNVETYPHQDETDVKCALAAVIALLNDESNIRPGEWRESQREFCRLVSWDRLGTYLFSGGRAASRKSLGEQTLAFIEGNYRDEIEQEDREILETLSDRIPKEPKDEELDFFARWQEKLNHPNIIKIFKSWQKRLFSKEVVGQEMLSTFSEGFEALIIAGSDKLSEMKEPCVLVRTTQHNKAMFWEKLDIDIQNLFRFELQCMLGLFGDRVLWDLDACFEYDAKDQSSSNEARKVDLELYLVERVEVVDLAGLKNPPKTAARVKATWQPGLKSKNEPIGLALPKDIDALALAAKNDAGLFRKQVFAPRSGGDESRIASTTLTDTNSFSDVAQTQDGRMFDTTIRTKDDILSEIRTKVSHLVTSKSLDPAAAKTLIEATNTFDEAYCNTIRALAMDPETGFAGEAVVIQVDAFGALCRACRMHAKSERAKLEIRPLVAEIGIVPSDGTDPMAIIAAWHPFRLAERRAKILDLAEFVESVLSSGTARNADLTIAFEERRALTGRWVFPEAAIVNGITMIAVEDVAGYSLLVPADCVARSQEALESSSPLAAEKFMEGVNQYLEVHPHEATNLSAAIFDSESLTLPKEIARLMGQRIHRDPDLRCDLVITHHEQGRMRSIYRNQNTRLEAENISDTAKGFLSRLRIDVRPNVNTDGHEDAIRNMDLVFLHDAVSHHAKPLWDLELGRANEFNAVFDLSAARRPRRRLAEFDAPGVGIYLTAPRPPRAVAEYQDLLYEMEKAAVLPEGYHGVLIRQVQFDDPNVGNLIRRAHELGEWVVSYDGVSSRTLLEKCGVQIIRDISLPGSSGRVIISAGKIDDRLKLNIRENLVKACGIDKNAAAALGDAIVKDVLQISGQKVLSAARYANASREMIGLSLMRAYIEASLPKELPENNRPIWISLDDYRGWFTSGKGKVADAVGFTILDTDEGFELLVQVGEAKFIGMASEISETKEAQKQVRATVERLTRIFIDNEDSISHTAWCSRLANLLVNRDGLTERLPDSHRRAAFLEALSAGDVTFRISGEAVICLHDDHATTPKFEYDPDLPHLRHHVLPTPIIRQVLKTIAAGGLPDRDELKDVNWYSREDEMPVIAPNPTKPTNSSQPVPAKSKSLSEGTQEIEKPEQPSSSQHALEEQQKASEISTEQSTSVVTTSQADINNNDNGVITSHTDKERPRFIPEPVYTVLQELADTEHGTIDDPASIKWAESICNETQRALSHFGMQAHFADPKFRLTPNGALITFRGHETLTIGKIEKKTGELLTTYGIEVIDVRPGRGQISLFVKRDKRANVPLASAWLGATWPDRDPGELTNFILGAREDDDRLLYLNIAGSFADYEEHGPHTLIAGETNSGKGVLTQGLLLQLITFNDPANAELILVDPKKGVDFGWLKGAAHLVRPIITEMHDAESVFQELVEQMDDRYELFAKVGVPNIAQYNRKMAPEKQLSRIYLVHDEMGAWMAQEKEYQDVVLSAVANLGMKARAAGIHLILITQRADADAVPTKLRDNMGNRLCLKVQNSTGSRMVLGVGGAEKLLGKGHLACILANESSPAGQQFYVVQVPFADTEDMQRLAEAAMTYWKCK